MRRVERILIAVMIAWFAIAGAACSGPSRETEVGNPSPETDVVQPTYRNQAYGVTITHPEELVAVEVSVDEVRFVPQSASSGDEAVARFYSFDEAVELTDMVSGGLSYEAPGFDQGLVVTDVASQRTTIYLVADTLLVTLESTSLEGFSIAKDPVKEGAIKAAEGVKNGTLDMGPAHDSEAAAELMQIQEALESAKGGVRDIICSSPFAPPSCN